MTGASPATAHAVDALARVQVPEAPRLDRAAAVAAVRDLLDAFGQDATSPQLRDTPRRVVDALEELLSPEPFEPTTFPDEAGYEGVVVVRDVAVQSLCAHHLLPFVGVAHIAYLPCGRVAGLSKLVRAVDAHARRLQVQEHLTAQVADWVMAELAADGAAVVVQAEHLCMALRGVRARGTTTITTSLRGRLRRDPTARAEVLAQLR